MLTVFTGVFIILIVGCLSIYSSDSKSLNADVFLTVKRELYQVPWSMGDLKNYFFRDFRLKEDTERDDIRTTNGDTISLYCGHNLVSLDRDADIYASPAHDGIYQKMPTSVFDKRIKQSYSAVEESADRLISAENLHTALSDNSFRDRKCVKCNRICQCFNRV